MELRQIDSRIRLIAAVIPIIVVLLTYFNTTTYFWFWFVSFPIIWLSYIMYKEKRYGVAVGLSIVSLFLRPEAVFWTIYILSKIKKGYLLIPFILIITFYLHYWRIEWNLPGGWMFSHRWPYFELWEPVQPFVLFFDLFAVWSTIKLSSEGNRFAWFHGLPILFLGIINWAVLFDCFRLLLPEILVYIIGDRTHVRFRQ